MNPIRTLPHRYRESVTHVEREPPTTAVAVSVIVTTFRTPRTALREALDGLDGQTAGDFETIVVDNGNDWDVASTARENGVVTGYLALDGNPGVTVGRNLGAHLAEGDLLVFLDDDAVPASDFVDQHRRIHAERDVVAVRGRVKPKHASVFNELQAHYDLGASPRPYYVNVEGNASFDRETFLACSGFDEGLTGRAGYEGAELSYRLVTHAGRDRVLYHPAPVIYHDYATGVVQYFRKRTALERSRQQLLAEYPDLWRFITSYRGAGNARQVRDRPLPVRVKRTMLKAAGDLLTGLVSRGS